MTKGVKEYDELSSHLDGDQWKLKPGKRAQCAAEVPSESVVAPQPVKKRDRKRSHQVLRHNVQIQGLEGLGNVDLGQILHHSITPGSGNTSY